MAVVGVVVIGKGPRRPMCRPSVRWSSAGVPLPPKEGVIQAIGYFKGRRWASAGDKCVDGQAEVVNGRGDVLEACLRFDPGCRLP